ncbi:AMP-binding protein [Streptomyces sp. NPDC090445]|uniref:AMP-binding protein n=1 Tax=Streptomyces sp. NPDC090445 TaxID=3365963 RepID=UPI0037F77E94
MTAHQRVPSSGGHSVLGHLDAAVAAHPDRPAIETSADGITYRELAARVERTAARLTASGVRPGDRIVLKGERTAVFVITLLAAWRAGAVPAPVDGGHPPARIRAYETAAQARWTASSDLGADGSTGPDLQRHDGDCPEQDRAEGPEDSTPDPLSHILFTSGTTGRPAAVAVTDGPLRSMAHWYGSKFAPRHDDRVALLGGLGHDPLLRDVTAALMGAATLVIPEQAVLQVPGRLAQWSAATRPTILHATPALIEFGLLSGPEPDAGTAGPRLILSGGAPLSRGLAARVLLRWPSARLLNVYGATETPQIAAAHEVRPPVCAEGTDGDLLPIGTGVAGASVVLGRELPGTAAAADEIVVRSRSLAVGYVGTERSNDRFMPDPAGEPGYRVYRTGDLGTRGADGELYVAGRADRQVSVNGHRVALEEVEAAALRHPAVAHAEATFRTGPLGDVLALQVVAGEPEAVTAPELRRHLSAQLPGHAVPSAVRFTEAVLDANHKMRLSPRS